MWAPSKYDLVYPLSYLFTFTIAAPISMLVQLAYPKENLAQGARPTTPQLLMTRVLHLHTGPLSQTRVVRNPCESMS